MRWLKDNFERVLVTFITAFVAISLFLQVVSRYVMNFSITWTEEIATFGLMWITYFGAAIAVIQRRHIRITILSDLLPPRPRKIVDIFCNIAFLIFIGFISIGLADMTEIAYRTNQVAAASRMPRFIVIGGIFVAFIMIMIRLIQDTLRHVAEYRALGAPKQPEPVVDAASNGKDGGEK